MAIALTSASGTINLSDQLFGGAPRVRTPMPSREAVAIAAADRAMRSTRAGGGTPVRVGTASKAATDKGWIQPGHIAPPADALHLNVGLQLGDDASGLDLDIDDRLVVRDVIGALAHLLAGAPVRWRPNSPRLLILARPEQGARKVVWHLAVGGKIERLAAGQQAVVFGTHPSGAKLLWNWPDESTHDSPPPVRDLSVVTAQQIEDALVAAGIKFTGGLAKTLTPTPVAIPLNQTGAQGAPLPTSVAGPLVPSSGFDIDLFMRGIAALDRAKPSIGNAGFEAVVAGAVNEARITAPNLEPMVVSLLKATLRNLPKWNGANDDIRITSYASPNPMHPNPKRFGSFIAEVDKYAPGWRVNLGVAPGAQITAPVNSQQGGPSQHPALFKTVKASASGTILRRRKPLLGSHLTRGDVTILPARTKTGKSTFSITAALSLTSAKALVGIPPLKRPLRVLYISGEESIGELAAKVEAARIEHNLTPTDLDGLALVGADEAVGLVLSTTVHRQGGVIVEDGFEALRRAAAAHETDVLVLDPLASFFQHDVSDNAVAAQAMLRLNRLARDQDMAILVLGHTRKGEAVDFVDAALGAQAWTAQAREVIALVPMTETEAATFNIARAATWRYSRIASLGNFAPPSAIGMTRWLEKVSVTIPGTSDPPDYPTDMVVGAVRSIILIPGGISDDMRRAAIALILAGHNGLPWGRTAKSKARNIVPELAEKIAPYTRHGDADERLAEAVLKELEQNDYIEVDDIQVPKLTGGGGSKKLKGLAVTSKCPTDLKP